MTKEEAIKKLERVISTTADYSNEQKAVMVEAIKVLSLLNGWVSSEKTDL